LPTTWRSEHTPMKTRPRACSGFSSVPQFPDLGASLLLLLLGPMDAQSGKPIAAFFKNQSRLGLIWRETVAVRCDPNRTSPHDNAMSRDPGKSPDTPWREI
jgi:hypothetical protein